MFAWLIPEHKRIVTGNWAANLRVARWRGQGRSVWMIALAGAVLERDDLGGFSVDSYSLRPHERGRREGCRPSTGVATA